MLLTKVNCDFVSEPSKMIVMATLAIPIAPLAYAWKNSVISNHPPGIAGAVAIVGYSIYEGVRKK